MLFDIPYAVRNNSGIYAIVNKVNGKVYIGSATNLRCRHAAHVSYLKSGKHANDKLLKSVRKHGLDNFVFTLLELTDKKDLLLTEQKWINNTNAVTKGYNICPNARSILGIKMRPEARQRLSTSLTGRKLTPEHRENLSNAHKGYAPSQSHKDKIGAAQMAIRQFKPVCQLNVDGEIMQTFSNAFELKKSGFKNSVIGRVLRGERKVAYGSLWQYAA